ncbi:MAG: YihY/virulence factor BrkB family protein [Bacteroidota bacterium]
MIARLRNFWHILIEAGNDFIDDHCTKLSASLAYYTIFSIGPLLLVIITLIGLFYKKTDMTNHVFEQMGEFVGPSAAATLEGLLINLTRQQNTTIFGIIGGIVFVFGATGVFTEIQSSINYIWSIKAKPKRSWVKYLLDRLMSFLFVIGVGLLLLVSLLLNVVVDLITTRLEKFTKLQQFLGESEIFLLKGVNLAILFVIVTFFFSIIYKVLPDAKIYWKDSLVGSSFAAVLFLIGKFLISYYVGKSSLINSYGAAASLIILLSWIYYSAIILYFGAQFTKVYAMKWGRGITVLETAVYIIKREAKELPKLKHPVQEN